MTLVCDLSYPKASVDADLSPTLCLKATTRSGASVQVSLINHEGRVLRKSTVFSGHEALLVDLAKEDVELWWPAGLGKQTLYTARADLTDAVSSSYDDKIPITERAAKVRQGRTFHLAQDWLQANSSQARAYTWRAR